MWLIVPPTLKWLAVTELLGLLSCNLARRFLITRKYGCHQKIVLDKVLSAKNVTIPCLHKVFFHYFSIIELIGVIEICNTDTLLQHCDQKNDEMSK